MLQWVSIAFCRAPPAETTHESRLAGIYLKLHPRHFGRPVDGPIRGFGRMTGNPEVIPGQKSAWGRSSIDVPQARFWTGRQSTEGFPDYFHIADLPAFWVTKPKKKS